MNCALCGLPAHGALLRDGEHAYCCAGCREVARLLGSDAAPRPEPAPAAAGTPAPCAEAFYWIDGMHCASCERLIELVAERAEGVRAVHANGATGTARVIYDPGRADLADLAARLGQAGYRLRPRGEAAPEYDERPELLRMLVGACLASAVMMLSFVFVYPVHAGWLDRQDYAAIAWLALDWAPRALCVLTTIQVFGVGWPILRGAVNALRAGGLNMDALLAVALISSYGYSVAQLWIDPLDLYFDAASGIVAIVTIGRYLERSAREAALAEMRGVMEAPPARACIVRAGQCFTCGADEVAPGDRVFVRQGEVIPVDGTIADGAGAVDESVLTGEPFPAARTSGDRVLGGSVLREGRIEIDAGAEVRSRIADLSRVLWSAQTSTGATLGRADRIARAFVPAVIVLAACVGIGLILAGAEPRQALLAALSTLIVSCPCTFGLAIPLTLAGATSEALRRGIVVTRPGLFDRAARVDIVAIDKTGTLSTGEMMVAAVVGPPEVAVLAAAVEREAPHPVARAIAQLDRRAIARELELHPGRGACARVGQRRVAVGSAVLFERLQWPIAPELHAQLAAHADGASVVSYVGWEGAARGAIVTRDRPRPHWDALLSQLRQRARVVLLTGAAGAGSYAAHVDEAFTGVPPEAKAAAVRRLRAGGRVAMIGDGSNDAPALAEADLSIAFGSCTALAAQAADIVVTGGRLASVADALELVEAARRRVRQNLAWALTYNALALPLAMSGAFNPMWAAVAMTASSILVVSNSTRSLFSRPATAGDAGPDSSGEPLATRALPP